MRVLTDEQLDDAYSSAWLTPAGGHTEGLRNVERAVVAALAERGGVVIGRVLDNIACASQCREMVRDEDNRESVLREAVADALRLALAQQEARHAEREPTYEDALAALLSKVPPLSDDALLSIFDEDVKSPSASLLSGLRAVARAARGESK